MVIRLKTLAAQGSWPGAVNSKSRFHQRFFKKQLLIACYRESPSLLGDPSI